MGIHIVNTCINIMYWLGHNYQYDRGYGVTYAIQPGKYQLNYAVNHVSRKGAHVLSLKCPRTDISCRYDILSNSITVYMYYV